MPYWDDTDFLQILRGELRQNLWLDRVITKRLLVLTQTKAAQPS